MYFMPMVQPSDNFCQGRGMLCCRLLSSQTDWFLVWAEAALFSHDFLHHTYQSPIIQSQYKDHLSRYRDSHYKDKMVVIQFYLYNGNAFTGTTHIYIETAPRLWPWKYVYWHLNINLCSSVFKAIRHMYLYVAWASPCQWTGGLQGTTTYTLTVSGTYNRVDYMGGVRGCCHRDFPVELVFVYIMVCCTEWVSSQVDLYRPKCGWQ